MNRTAAVFAACALAIVTAAIAVQVSLDDTPPPPVELGDFDIDFDALPAADLFVGVQATTVIEDGFDRADAATLATADTGQAWVDLGAWRIEDGQARIDLRPRETEPRLALVPMPAGEQLITVDFDRLGGGAGLVFSYLDAQNYWAVVASPAFALWQVWQVVDGGGSVVATLGPPARIETGTQVGVHVLDDRTDFYLDRDRYVTVNRAAESEDRFVGLAALRPSASEAGWDRFAVVVPDD